MRETTKNKIREFKAAAQKVGFEVTTEKTESGGILLSAVNAGSDFFELLWDRQGRFVYGPSYFNSKRVRNVAEATRYLRRFAYSIAPANRKEWKTWAVANVSTKADNRLGYAPRWVSTPFEPKVGERNCHFCIQGARADASTSVAAIVRPDFRTFPAIELKGISVEYYGACTACAAKHVETI